MRPMQHLNIALVGAGMFGGGVHARAYAEFQSNGLSPHLGRLGLGGWAQDLAGIQIKFVGIATRTKASATQAAESVAAITGAAPPIFFGDQAWKDLLKTIPNVDVLAVATPDDLHTPVVLDGLSAGAHVICEKPLCLETAEADRIIAVAQKAERIVALDMHKRYDPDHLRIKDQLLTEIGEPLYGTAYLEEPLEVSTKTFKWVERSDPFSYVGCHWVDLIQHYFHSKPVALTAVGQKRRLLSQGINAFDAVQVRVDYQNGMSICYHNNWVTPNDFEGPVNQGHEIVGTKGKIESDQQYRGLRWWREGGGSRTANTHFTREVRAAEPGPGGVTGYGYDSLVVALAAICRAKFFNANIAELSSIFPNLEDARIVVGILHAARVVRDLNFAHLQTGRGAPVSARFGRDGITIVDPFAGEKGRSVFERIYERPV